MSGDIPPLCAGKQAFRQWPEVLVCDVCQLPWCKYCRSPHERLGRRFEQSNQLSQDGFSTALTPVLTWRLFCKGNNYLLRHHVKKPGRMQGIPGPHNHPACGQSNSKQYKKPSRIRKEGNAGFKPQFPLP